MGDPRPTLCIVNWNGRHHLERSVPAALGFRDDFAEILVVDNGSTDDSIAWLEANAPDVRIVRLPENRGAGAARNAGIAHARSDRILFADNDVILLPGCAEALSSALDAHPRAAAAQAAVLYADRPEVVQYCGADSHYLGMMILRHADVPAAELPEEPFACDSLVTCCFMQDRARAGDVRFWEPYFYVNEDHDFGLQLRLRGLDILAVPRARVLHGEGAAGVSIRQLGHYSRVRVYHTIRNRWVVLIRTCALRTLLLTLPAHLLFEAAQFATVLRKGWLDCWVDALRWIWRHRRILLAGRRTLRATRRLPDGAILHGRPLPLRRELASGEVERRLIVLLDRLFAAWWRLVAPFSGRRAPEGVESGATLVGSRRTG